MALYGNKTGQTFPLGQRIRFSQLPREAVRNADSTDFARLNGLMQRLKHLKYWRMVIPGVTDIDRYVPCPGFAGFG